jgi:hypothetical protein
LEKVAQGTGNYYRVSREMGQWLAQCLETRNPCLYLPDERTLVIASEEEIRGWLTNGRSSTPQVPWRETWRTVDASSPFFMFAIDGQRYRKNLGQLPETILRKSSHTFQLMEQAPAIVLSCTPGKQVTLHVTAVGDSISGTIMGNALLENRAFFDPIFVPQQPGRQAEVVSIVIDAEHSTLHLKKTPRKSEAQPVTDVVNSGTVDSFKQLAFRHELPISVQQFLGGFDPVFCAEVPAPAAKDLAQQEKQLQAEVKMLEVPFAIVQQYQQKEHLDLWAEGGKKAVILTPAQSKALLDIAMGDVRTRVISSPRVTTLPEQTAYVQVGAQDQPPTNDPIPSPNWHCWLKLSDAANQGIRVETQGEYQAGGKAQPKHVVSWNYTTAEVVPPGQTLLLLAYHYPKEGKPQPEDMTVLLLITPNREPAKK